jgi:hypothetical protein
MTHPYRLGLCEIAVADLAQFRSARKGRRQAPRPAIRQSTIHRAPLLAYSWRRPSLKLSWARHHGTPCAASRASPPICGRTYPDPGVPVTGELRPAGGRLWRVSGTSDRPEPAVIATVARSSRRSPSRCDDRAGRRIAPDQTVPRPSLEPSARRSPAGVRARRRPATRPAAAYRGRA